MNSRASSPLLSVSSSESEPEYDPVKEINKKPKAKKQRKVPSLCTVEQLAIKFMYDIYDWDSRYEIDENEKERLEAIRKNLEERKDGILD